MIERRTQPSENAWSKDPLVTPTPGPSFTHGEIKRDGTNRITLPEPRSPVVAAVVGKPLVVGKPKLVRGRSQSDIGGQSTKKPRPTPYSRPPQNTLRPSFESTDDIGLNTATTSDLPSRNALGYNTVQPTPLVREGRGPTAQLVGHVSGDGYLAPTENLDAYAYGPFDGLLVFDYPHDDTWGYFDARGHSPQLSSRSQQRPVELPVSMTSRQMFIHSPVTHPRHSVGPHP